MTHAAEMDAASDPVGAGLIRAIGIVFVLSCDSTGGGWCALAKPAIGTDLIRWLLEMLPFLELTDTFDKRGLRMHNVVIVGSARQPASLTQFSLLDTWAARGM